MTTNNPANWFEIYVNDMKRAKKFYSAMLKVKFTKLNAKFPEMWGFPSNMKKYGTSGSLVSMPGVKAGGNSTVIYFRCDDCAVEAKRAKKAGGTIHKEKFSIGEYGFISLVFDTEGNLFGLQSME